MPKSKRSKVVSLTAVKPKRADLKRDLVESIRECVESYPYVYVFTFDNMRSQKFKEMRAEWTDRRFFLGKNRVMQKALGEDAGDAAAPNLHLISADLVGNVGLLFSHKNKEAVEASFTAAAENDYARAGFIPSETITVPAGHLEEMPHTMAETLRKLGMPIKLDKGKVVLTADYTICKRGEPINPDQGRLLKHFGHALATFQLHLISGWHKKKYSNYGFSRPVISAAADVDGDGADSDDDAVASDGLDED